VGTALHSGGQSRREVQTNLKRSFLDALSANSQGENIRNGSV